MNTKNKKEILIIVVLSIMLGCSLWMNLRQKFLMEGEKINGLYGTYQVVSGYSVYEDPIYILFENEAEKYMAYKGDSVVEYGEYKLADKNSFLFQLSGGDYQEAYCRNGLLVVSTNNGSLLVCERKGGAILLTEGVDVFWKNWVKKKK